MRTEADPFLRRLRWITWTIVLILVLWQFLPWIERYLIGLTAEPRAVTPRGELAADEQAIIQIFEQASPSVVFITTRQRVVSPWTRNVLSVPRGTGSGFVWDGLGHMVTNNHVIENSSEATVRLNDGRSYSAVLVGTSPVHDLAVLRINVPFNRPPPVPIGPSLGISVDADINRALTEQLDIQGVLVITVEPGSAAEAAGLRATQLDRRGNVIPGDVILAIDGQRVESVFALLSKLDNHRIGDRVTLRVWRSGRELDLSVVLQADR